MAEAGFHHFFPGANPSIVQQYLPIFECDHRAHLGCLLNSVYSYCLRDDTWGIRSPSTYRCGACYSPLRRDIRAFSQFWGARSTFPGNGHRSDDNNRAHIYPRQIPMGTLLHMHYRPMPYNAIDNNPDPANSVITSRLHPEAPDQMITSAWGMDFTAFPPTGLLIGPGIIPPITWLVHILL